jgi:hypothetical protein
MNAVIARMVFWPIRTVQIPGIRRFERRWQVPGLRLMSTGILAVNSGFALGKRIHDRKNARFVVATMPSRSISK